VRVDTKHVKVCIDRQDVIASLQIEAGLDCLTLKLVREEFRLPVNEVDSIFKLALLRQNLDMQEHKLFIVLKLWLLHELEHQ
jgi:hypothetical protein